MIDIKKEKGKFLLQMKCWTKTQHKGMEEKKAWAAWHALNAAVGRKSPLFYKNSECRGDKAFKNDWQVELLKAGNAYRNPVPDKIEGVHIRKIKSIARRLSKKHGRRVLHQGKMRIGNSQKALNLYLKFLWCLGEIPYTPHCPLDRKILIQELKLGQSAKWTACEDISTYKGWIGACMERAQKLKNGKIKQEEILSYWELVVWAKLCYKKRNSPASLCK